MYVYSDKATILISFIHITTYVAAIIIEAVTNYNSNIDHLHFSDFSDIYRSFLEYKQSMEHRTLSCRITSVTWHTTYFVFVAFCLRLAPIVEIQITSMSCIKLKNGSYNDTFFYYNYCSTHLQKLKLWKHADGYALLGFLNTLNYMKVRNYLWLFCMSSLLCVEQIL